MPVRPSHGEEGTCPRDGKNPESLMPSRFCGGRNRTRTCDPIDVNDVLYQLSHATKNIGIP